MTLNNEVRKNVGKGAVASVPITILGLIWNTMNTLTKSVTELNSSLSVIAGQVGRNSQDIQYQRDRYDKSIENMDRIKDSLNEIRGYIKEQQIKR